MSLLRRTARPLLRRIDQRIDRKLRKELGNAKEELQRLKEQQHSIELLLGSDGRRFNRHPSPAQLGAVAKQVGAATGEKHARRAVIQAYRTLVEVENRGVGRIAGGTSNILGKLATTPLLKPPNGDILEIGTLYGLFAGCLARQMLRAGIPYHLTIVDPIAPVQLQEGMEITVDASGTPISEDIVRANLHYAGVLPDRVRLLRGYSTDDDIHATLAGGKFGVIVVDGDHSAKGVKADLEWVEELAAPGAVIVIDDYDDRVWPGVKEATDEHLASGKTRFTKIGQVTTSAFLRAE
ncbi:class I SAM-dependent methyltransferase [Streptomyces litchfieldiae]|uniref:Class I SAM-dependent methyltransferase n=1 Tax=Streptomyces litchfieldiae TaxID=3075543 RepID=A0ABU2MKG0_9ACTN|nr:class I SAM-dependent methyltransferase [Streptomyces sp. DSM 44938]MDT0342096.1 class I SAM-dependent methyltransferase [Streptomyces sp. DSM 44938]